MSIYRLKEDFLYSFITEKSKVLKDLELDRGVVKYINGSDTTGGSHKL